RPGIRLSLCANLDLDLDRHAEMIGRKTGPRARHRHRLARITRDSDADQVVIADDAVGRIELDPAGARQVNLEPGMGRVAADIPSAPTLADVEIAASLTIDVGLALSMT